VIWSLETKRRGDLRVLVGQPAAASEALVVSGKLFSVNRQFPYSSNRNILTSSVQMFHPDSFFRVLSQGLVWQLCDAHLSHCCET